MCWQIITFTWPPLASGTYSPRLVHIRPGERAIECLPAVGKVALVRWLLLCEDRQAAAVSVGRSRDGPTTLRKTRRTESHAEEGLKPRASMPQTSLRNSSLGT